MILELKNLHCVLQHRVVVDGISLQVPPGQTVGVIGPNGSGKTTLFNCIGGFVPISGGEILFRGSAVHNFGPHARARHGLGRVFQSPGIFREMTVLENLLVALEARSAALKILFPWQVEARSLRARAGVLLDEVGLGGKRDERAGSLSGGQLRLLEIQRALAYGAEAFLLDEPTAGVSPKMRAQVVGAITRIQALGKTILIIEHDLAFIEQFCSRILVLDGGKVVLDGTPAEVRKSPVLQEIYFGASAASSKLTAASSLV